MNPIRAGLASTPRSGTNISLDVAAAAGYGYLDNGFRVKVSDPEFSAFMVIWCGAGNEGPCESRHLLTLRLALLEAAIKHRQRERWPKRHKGKLWLEDTVYLVLDEFRWPRMARLPEWWLGRVEATQAEWDKFYAPKYETIHSIGLGWCNTGYYKIKKALEVSGDLSS